MTAGEEVSVHTVFNVCKDVVMTVAAEVVGYRVCRDRVKVSKRAMKACMKGVIRGAMQVE